MPIYDRPTKVLMQEFAKERLTPDTVFGKKEAVDWFASRYPDIRPTTVQMHVEGMAVNSGSREHHPSIKPGSGHDLFYKVAPGRFRLWRKESDPAPLYKGDAAAASDVASDPVDEIDHEFGSSEFAYERDLRNYLSKNLGSLEPGLKLFQEEGLTGVEYPVGGRFIDILAVDKEEHFVVIELKVSRGYDRTMGQLLRYMAWIKANLAEGSPVRGVIVAGQIGDDLKLAASEVQNVQLSEYEIAFKLRPLV